MMFTSGQFWQACSTTSCGRCSSSSCRWRWDWPARSCCRASRASSRCSASLYFIPYILATVVSAVIWENLLSPTSGIGIGHRGAGHPRPGEHELPRQSFTGLALGRVREQLAVVGIPGRDVPGRDAGTDPSLYEAARIDGAQHWQEFRQITLPSIRPTLMFLALMTIIWSFLIFDYIYIMTQGGPADSTQVVGTLMYQEAFQDQAAGYASAMGLTLGFISICVVIVYTRLRKRGWNV